MGRIAHFLGMENNLATREEVGGPDEPSPAYPSQIAPPSRLAGRLDKTAVGLSMVYRAISIHAIAAKQMGIQHWREDVSNPSGSDARLPSSPFLRRPSIDLPRSAFIELCVTSLASTGNAYWLLDRDPQGRIRNVTILDPHSMNVVREDGVLKYYYAARQTPYTADRIQHLKLLRFPGTEYGLGPIQAARAEIEGALDLRDYSANWFKDTPQPTGVLTSDQHVSDKQAGEAKSRFNASLGGRRGVVVLGQGLTYSPVFLSPADAQFLDNMQFTTTQIARLFGAPASLMLAALEGNSQTYANVEQDWLGFVRFSNMQYLIEIEEAFTEVLPRFEYAKFNVEALLRADTTTRYSAYRQGIEAGWLLKSEVRKIENYPPVRGIDDPPKPPPAPAATQQEGTNDDDEA